jgi:hypothetical protein
MGQPIVVANQLAMKFDRLGDAPAAFPIIFSDPGLNATHGNPGRFLGPHLVIS